MTPNQLGHQPLAGALQDLQERVRSAPGDVALRTSLFQLLAILGQWERALQQLRVVGELDRSSAMWVRVLESCPRCELLRSEIFSGARTPLVMGEPEAWVAQLIEALRQDARGEHGHAAALRDEALADAPGRAGRCQVHAVASAGGKEERELAFDWFGDSDTRLGPVFEVILEGRYLWIPQSRVHALEIAPPKTAHDLLWIPARFEWVNGGEAHAFVPVRYPGSELCEDDALRLSRRTEWREPIRGRGAYQGLGQRLFFTGSENALVGDEVALLDLRRLEFETTGA